MGLRIRRLALRVTTSSGDYGTDISVPDGLVVLRADNSAGKSTCIQAIFYALGLEGMWSASHDIPLPHAMTDHLDDGGTAVPVLRSEVWLELENTDKSPLSVRRVVKGAGSRNLISTWLGRKLSSPSAHCEQEDYFVREPGAATRPRGFHHRLAEFLGWELPSVARFSGEQGPLYLECIFPLFVIEQKRGWSSLQARVPTHYRIRDVYRRAVEFVLRLDAHENVQRRQQLQRETEVIKEQWAAVVAACDAIAAQVNGMASALPRSPVGNWDDVQEPTIQVLRDGWVHLGTALTADRAALAVLTSEVMPRVEQVADEVASRLAGSEGELRLREFQLSQAYERLETERVSLNGIDLRLSALQDDLRKNQDVLKLRNLGSVAQMGIASGHCPTCQQPLNDSLLPTEPGMAVMSVEDNVEFIKAQIETFTSAKEDAVRTVAAMERKVSAHRIHLDELRGRIRDLRRSLVSDGRLPSIDAMRRQLILEQGIAVQERAESALSEQVDKFQSLSERWALVQSQLSSIPSENLSDSDKEKLRKLESSFRTQLGEYGFTSVPPSSVSISTDSYRPEHEGFDLDFDLSASDMVRAIWAYMNAFLVIARDEGTNHPGMLVFDEPRQQETARPSFEGLLKQAAAAGPFRQQVIIATSEEIATLRALLAGSQHTLVPFEGKIIRKM